MHYPLVSINLTTFNRASLVSKAIDSVLSQTYPNIEIVVVDDCSTDNTQSVMNDYITNNNNIKYIRHHENKGNASARNTALEKCTGVYVAFMDDDDEWIDEEKLTKQVSILNNTKEKIGIVCSSVRLDKGDGVYIDKVIQKPNNLKTKILSGNGIIYSPTVMTSRKIMQQVGGFDLSMKRGVDSEFYRTCVVQFKYDVFFMEEITTRIREHGEDRMTPVLDRDEIKKTIKANLYLVKKYYFDYILSPKALFARFKTIFYLLLNYVRAK